MHEYSIVQSLLNLCEENAEENSAEKITKVVVKIGTLSGVEPYLLESAFNTFKEKTICDGAEFIMNIQPVVVRCGECNKESQLGKMHYKCPHCDSIDVATIDGEEMYLMSLEME